MAVLVEPSPKSHVYVAAPVVVLTNENVSAEQSAVVGEFVDGDAAVAEDAIFDGADGGGEAGAGV